MAVCRISNTHAGFAHERESYVSVSFSISSPHTVGSKNHSKLEAPPFPAQGARSAAVGYSLFHFGHRQRLAMDPIADGFDGIPYIDAGCSAGL